MNIRILSGAAGVLGGLALLIRKLAGMDGNGLYYAGIALGVVCFFLMGLLVVRKGAIWLDVVVGVALAAFGYGLLLLPLGGKPADDPGSMAIKGVILLLLGAGLLWSARGKSSDLGSHAHAA